MPFLNFLMCAIGAPHQGILPQRARGRAPGANGGSDSLTAAMAKGRCNRSRDCWYLIASFIVQLELLFELCLSGGFRIACMGDSLLIYLFNFGHKSCKLFKASVWPKSFIYIISYHTYYKSDPSALTDHQAFLVHLQYFVFRVSVNLLSGQRNHSLIAYYQHCRLRLVLKYGAVCLTSIHHPQIEGKFTAAPGGLTNLFYGCID